VTSRQAADTVGPAGSVNGKHPESVSLFLHKHKKGADSFFQKLNIHSDFSLPSVYQNNISLGTVGTTAVNFYTAIQQKLVAFKRSSDNTVCF
jgi:hypothetical protein